MTPAEICAALNAACPASAVTNPDGSITVTGTDGSTATSPPAPTPPNTATIYAECYAARSANGTTQLFGRDATITRTGTGQWTVTFATPHPDGANYAASLTTEESGTQRDTPDIWIVEGSVTANGFNVMITTGDNGGNPDILVDAPWMFSVDCPVEVLVP